MTDHMKISIQVKPNAKENKVEKMGHHQFLVKVKAPPKEKKANKEVIETLAKYFDLPPSRLSIVAGLRSRQKIVNIGEA
jgi:uncharacterized protein (TIGR00251 family)